MAQDIHLLSPVIRHDSYEHAVKSSRYPVFNIEMMIPVFLDALVEVSEFRLQDLELVVKAPHIPI
jgi:hypothetical protein